MNYEIEALKHKLRLYRKMLDRAPPDAPTVPVIEHLIAETEVEIYKLENGDLN